MITRKKRRTAHVAMARRSRMAFRRAPPMPQLEQPDDDERVVEVDAATPGQPVHRSGLPSSRRPGGGVAPAVTRAHRDADVQDQQRGTRSGHGPRPARADTSIATEAPAGFSGRKQRQRNPNAPVERGLHVTVRRVGVCRASRPRAAANRRPAPRRRSWRSRPTASGTSRRSCRSGRCTTRAAAGRARRRGR